MAILTKAQFASIAQNKAGARGLQGRITESRLYSKAASVTSIFLSHSHHDKAIVEQAKYFFENLGISIYVDWADETMPEKTSAATAQKIKNQIITVNDKFVLLATNNAVSSKWCNWEIGIADPHKLLKDKIAILPLAENSGNWEGNEYLQIYPRIERISTSGSEYWVITPNNNVKNLYDWLKN